MMMILLMITDDHFRNNKGVQMIKGFNLNVDVVPYRFLKFFAKH